MRVPQLDCKTAPSFARSPKLLRSSVLPFHDRARQNPIFGLLAKEGAVHSGLNIAFIPFYFDKKGVESDLDKDF